MTAIKDDYDGYLAHIKNIPNNEIRADTLKVIKWTMIKRTVIKIMEFSITLLITSGIITSLIPLM